MLYVDKLLGSMLSLFYLFLEMFCRSIDFVVFYLKYCVKYMSSLFVLFYTLCVNILLFVFCSISGRKLGGAEGDCRINRESGGMINSGRFGSGRNFSGGGRRGGGSGRSFRVSQGGGSSGGGEKFFSSSDFRVGGTHNSEGGDKFLSGSGSRVGGTHCVDGRKGGTNNNDRRVGGSYSNDGSHGGNTSGGGSCGGGDRFQIFSGDRADGSGGGGSSQRGGRILSVTGRHVSARHVSGSHSRGGNRCDNTHVGGRHNFSGRRGGNIHVGGRACGSYNGCGGSVSRRENGRDFEPHLSKNDIYEASSEDSEDGDQFDDVEHGGNDHNEAGGHVLVFVP